MDDEFAALLTLFNVYTVFKHSEKLEETLLNGTFSLFLIALIFSIGFLFLIIKI